MNETTIHLYVNMPEKLPAFQTIAEALESVTWESAEKVYPAPELDLSPVIIHIGKGVYREKLDRKSVV